MRLQRTGRGEQRVTLGTLFLVVPPTLGTGTLLVRLGRVAVTELLNVRLPRAVPP